MSPNAGSHVHVVRFAPAKLNLTLAVTGRRADGFHALHSIMVPLSLGDALTVRVSGPAIDCDSIRVLGLPVTREPDNLVLRAIAGARAAVAAANPEADPPAHLATLLSKRIPVAAGLGGGSSDAAAAIAAALGAWRLSLPADSVAELAASLGSDVPFFLAGRGAVVTGRGECVDPLPPIEEAPAILLVTPRVAVSTASVFKLYAGGHRPATSNARRISEELAAELEHSPRGATLLDRAADLAVANDLVPAAAAAAPGLAEFTASLGRLLDRPICQSGSGPTLWILYPTLEDARRSARLVRHGIAGGALPRLGDGEPFVAATLIAAAGESAAAANSSESGESGESNPAGKPALAPTDATPGVDGQANHSRGPATIHNWRSSRKPVAGDPDRRTEE